jgi:hypothetical protein
VIVVTPAPTAPAITAGAPASSFQTAILATPAPSAPQQIPVVLPTVAGFAATLSLPVPANLPANAALAESVSNRAIDPSAVPTLQDALRASLASRGAKSVTTTSLLFFKITSNFTLTFPNAPGFTLTMPATAIVPGAAYYLAEYNPLQPSLGWQLGFEGPGSITGSTATFTAPTPAIPFTLNAQVPLYFAVYAVSVTFPTPTPAPSASFAPTPTPIPGFTLSSPTVSLLSTGAQATETITDATGYTGTYSAASSAATVATAAVSGSTVTITAVGAGTATIIVGDAQGRSAAISVSVTLTQLPIQ